jgi:uncharacterized lipoprotein YddW (UPF0748 family)
MRFCLAVMMMLGLALPTRAADPPAQWRAFWVDAFNTGIKTPAQVERLVADVKALHCNTVIVQVRRRGDAYFRKTVDPFVEDPAVPDGFDPLGYLLEKAHAEGIQVHAWCNAMTLWRSADAPPRNTEHLFHRHGPGKSGRDSWLTCDEKGNHRFPVGYFLDAGHPEVANHYVRVLTDLVRKYPVDGVHLDYIRYPESEGGNNEDGYGVGYNPVSVARFNTAHQRSGTPPRNDAAWKTWRRQQVTQLVRRLRVELLDANPRVLFSAALIPWGDGPLTEADWGKSAPYNRVFQDWHNWRKEGLLDLIVPMNYDREARADQKAFFAHWVQFERAYPYRCQTVVGLGAYLNSLAGTEAQLHLALSGNSKVAPADGVCFFSYAWFRNGGNGDRPSIQDLREVLVTGKEGADAKPPFAHPVSPPNVNRVRQPSEGTLAGFAIDAAGRPLDSQIVKAENVDGGKTIEVKTDGNGYYAAVILKPGRYRVRLPGGAKETVVDVAAGKVTRLGQPAVAPNLIGD